MKNFPRHSRIANTRYTLNYGLDEIEGLFIQIFENNTRHAEDEDDELPVNLSQQDEPTLSIGRIVNIAMEYGFDISEELNNQEIEYD